MIIGLDLSSVNSGYAILDGTSLITFGSIIPSKKASHSEKLCFIYESIRELFSKYPITEVAIEDQHFRTNVDTLKLLSRIAGVAMLCAAQHGASVSLYPAPTIKLCFTGSGKADKKDMIAKAIERYELRRDQIDDNIADSIGVCYTHVMKTNSTGGP